MRALPITPPAGNSSVYFDRFSRNCLTKLDCRQNQAQLILPKKVCCNGNMVLIQAGLFSMVKNFVRKHSSIIVFAIYLVRNAPAFFETRSSNNPVDLSLLVQSYTLNPTGGFRTLRNPELVGQHQSGATDLGQFQLQYSGLCF